MNRQQRRRAASTERQPGGPNIPSESFFPDSAAAPATVTKPGFLVRGFAAIVLSSWVLRRVRHPAARAALALVAHEVGRHELAAELEN